MLYAVLRKECITYFTDRAGLFQLLVFPLIQITLFSFLLANSGFDGMRIAVVDLAGSEVSRAAIARLEEANLAPETTTAAGLDRAITHGSLLAGVVLPADYPATPARLYLSPVQSGASKPLGRLLEDALAGGGSMLVVSDTMPGSSGVPGAMPPAPVEQFWGSTRATAIPTNTAAAGYVILTLFFIVVTLGRALLTEQTAGVFKRMQGTPVTGTILFLGKWLPAWGVSLLQACLFLSFGHFALGLDLGPAVTVIPTVLVISATASALGLHLGAFARTENQVTAIGVGSSLALAALGGCFAPLYLLPKWLQFFSWVIPQHWALVALQQGIAYESGLSGLLPALGILAGFTALFAALGARQFGVVLRRG